MPLSSHLTHNKALWHQTQTNHTALDQHNLSVRSRVMPSNQLPKLINRFMNIMSGLIVMRKTNIKNPNLRPITSHALGELLLGLSLCGGLCPDISGLDCCRRPSRHL